jgi:hypothetical protein
MKERTATTARSLHRHRYRSRLRFVLGELAPGLPRHSPVRRRGAHYGPPKQYSVLFTRVNCTHSPIKKPDRPGGWTGKNRNQTLSRFGLLQEPDIAIEPVTTGWTGRFWWKPANRTLLNQRFWRARGPGYKGPLGPSHKWKKGSHKWKKRVGRWDSNHGCLVTS